MKFSYNWLKELSGTKKSIDELADLFMIHSFEVEGIEDLSEGLDGIVIGEIMKKEKHPDADRLSIATVNVGNNKLQIVCGAPNLEVGQKVPVALVGCVLKGEFEIKKSKIRGIVSHGMICAEDELGIGNDHDGIMVLPSDAPIGKAFAEYAGLNDKIIDLDILPNRGHDCLSYNGIANEIRAFENNKQNTFVNASNLPKVKKELDVKLETKNCNRYIGVKIDNIKIKESPEWLKVVLASSDIAPINNIVDITNYVMLETGQPLHAFDADKIANIIVRQAHKNEKIVLLDEQELELDCDDIVISDRHNAVALAGVMGGRDSAINDKTQNVILEGASFNSSSIRFSQRKYNLQTDAAYRFERDLDPNLASLAVNRALELITELASGEISAVSDIYPEPVVPWTIKLSVVKVAKMLGTTIATEEIQSILEKLNMEVEPIDEDYFIVTVPTVRLDLHSPEDLIEEIGRMYGYNKIKPKPLSSNVQTPERNETRFFERTLKDVLVYGGFDEVRGYSFYSQIDAQAVGIKDENHISLMNPMNPQQVFMRRTLMPNLLNFTKKNLSYFDRIQIFEIGRIYDPVINSLPNEKLVLGAVVASSESSGIQFFELKGMLEILLDRINIGEYYFDNIFNENDEHIPDLHPSRRALIKMKSGEILGWIGETTKQENKYFGLKKKRVAICELDIELILAKVNDENFFEPLAKFPFISRDLSIKVGERVCVGDVERIMYMAGGKLVRDIDLFDLYQNKETNEKSMAFHILFGHDEHTLKAQEVDEKIKIIVEVLETELDVEIRK
jgi:phenylalanyl-tRNA synthetase beta chain